jgi:hypothetical protein
MVQSLRDLMSISKFLWPSLVLAISIGAFWGDPLTVKVTGALGMTAAVTGYLWPFVSLPLFRKNRNPQGHDTQRGTATSGEWPIASIASVLLFEGALAMTIKELDEIPADARTAEWFRDRIGHNLAVLVGDDANAASRELIRRLTIFPQ